MEIARNIWLFITRLLLVTSCFPGVEGEDKEENRYEAPCILDSLADPLGELLKNIQVSMPMCGDFTNLKETINILQNGIADYTGQYGPLYNQPKKGLQEASECLEIASRASGRFTGHIVYPRRAKRDKHKEKKSKGCVEKVCKNATNDSNGNKCECDSVENSTGATKEDNVSAMRKDSTSAGTALLFFLLGLILGLVTLTLVCICCPATHTKATSLLNAAKRPKETKGDKSVSRMTLNEARDEEVVPSSITVDMTDTQDNRQSNMYNEPDIYNELTCEGDGRSYDTARNQPVLERAESSGYNRLHTGPVNISQGHTYQPFIPEGNQIQNYSALQLDGQRDPAVQSKFDTPPQDTMPAEDPHDYFVLEANSDKTLDTTPVPGPDNNNPETVGHDYFVLEAQTSAK